MTLLFSTTFRLLLWIFLTSDLRPINLVIGLGVALLLPRDTHAKEPLLPLLRAVGTSLVAIPTAYGEAVALMLANGREQVDCTQKQISAHASSRVVFLELLAITITPFTLVLDLHRVHPSHPESPMSFRIHRLRPKARPHRGRTEP